MRTIFILFLSLCCFHLSSEGQDQKVGQFSLEEAQAFAMENNDSIKMAKLDQRVSELQVKETTAIGLPQVSGKLGLSYFFDIPTQLLPDFITPSIYGILQAEDIEIKSDPNNLPIGGMTPAQFGTEYNVSAELAVNQLIFDGQYIVGLKASKAVKALSTSMRNTTEINIKANIAKLYLQTLVLAENQEILAKNNSELDKNIIETKALIAEGLTDEIDLDRLTLSKQRLNNELQNIVNAHALVKLLLKLQMGYPVEDAIDLSDNVESLLLYQGDFLNEEANASDRPEYKTLEINKDLMMLDMKRWKAGYLPQVSGFFTYTQNAMMNELDLGNGDNWFPTTVGGLSVSIPIFDGLSKMAKVQMAKVEMERADIAMRQFEQAVQMQVQKQRNDYDMAQNNLETEAANLALAQKIYDRSKILYDEGMGSSFEMTSALTELYAAQSAHLQASLKLVTTQINLQKALGKY